MNVPIRNGGPIAWMARNSVAANLLMLVLIIGGIAMMFQIRQEYLPSTEPDTVDVSVALPGATPAEVEQSIVLALEDALTRLRVATTLVKLAPTSASHREVWERLAADPVPLVAWVARGLRPQD